MKNAQNRVQNIENLLKSAERNLRKANILLETLRKDLASTYDDVPGVLGVFDGSHMVTPDGKKYEVNPNYAAKSLLCVGDNLKMVEEGDKQLFKQVSKGERKRLEGILNKKEGNWHALTDAGSYRLLDVAVEFKDGQVNDELVVLVPEDNLNAEWAALEKFKKEEKVEPESAPTTKSAPKTPQTQAKEAKKKEEKKSTPKPAPKPEKKVEKKKVEKKAAPKKAAPKKEEVKEEVKDEKVDSLVMEDDDLV